MQLLFPKPLITTTTAHLISLGFGCVYVGSLYLSKNGRLSFSSNRKLRRGNGNGNGNGLANGIVPREKMKDERWRDDPDVIRARLAAVSIATVECCLGVLGVLWWHVGGEWRNLDIALDAAFLRLGLLFLVQPLSSLSLLTDEPIRWLLPHLVTPLLFLGPLYGAFLGKQLPGQRNWMWKTHVVARFFGIQGVRNYWVAPITEELVFRACVLAIYHLSGASRMRMIFLGPLTFGLAHVHHAWETYNRYGRNLAAAKRAVFASLFQLAYTTLFGFHVSYLFLRTGSVLPAITAHIFCNVMGIPEITWELRRYPGRKRMIIAAYTLGIVGFVYTLGRWTRTEGNFYWPMEGDEAFVYGKY